VDKHHQNDGADSGYNKFTGQALLMQIEELEVGDDPVGGDCRQHPEEKIAQDTESSTLYRATYQTGYNGAYDDLQSQVTEGDCHRRNDHTSNSFSRGWESSPKNGKHIVCQLYLVLQFRPTPGRDKEEKKSKNVVPSEKMAPR